MFNNKNMICLLWCIMKGLYNKLVNIVGEENIIKNCDLTPYNTFKIHTKCKLLIKVKNQKQLIKLLNLLKKTRKSHFLLGNGSNLLLKRKFYKKIFIVTSPGENVKIRDLGNYIYLQCFAGDRLPYIVSMAESLSCQGLEWAVGLPASIGGATNVNAGAHGGSMSQIVCYVKYYYKGKIGYLKSNQFEFSYRDSIFKKKGYIILNVLIKLEKSDKNQIKTKKMQYIEKRINSQPLEFPSAGCVFVNPIMKSAGYYIDRAGLKGVRIGDACVSTKHANFIINLKDATGKDILRLIKLIKKEVKKQFFVELHSEIMVQ